MITKRIVDIHMHVIPGVDDGSVNMEMSLEMIRRATEQGVRSIVCTPHDIGYHERSDVVNAKFNRLRDRCAEVMPQIRLFMGCEMYCDLYKMEENFKCIEEGVYPTINGTRFVLSEFPIWDRRYAQIRSMCGDILDHGYIPILAHTERYHDTIEDVDNVAELREMGCRVQVNAYSIAEETHIEVREWANKLLEQRLIDFIGSDAHRTTHRPPMYSSGVNRIYKVCESDYADAICFGNAEELLIGVQE